MRFQAIDWAVPRSSRVVDPVDCQLGSFRRRVTLKRLALGFALSSFVGHVGHIYHVDMVASRQHALAVLSASQVSCDSSLSTRTRFRVQSGARKMT